MLGKGAAVAFAALIVSCGSADSFPSSRGKGGAAGIGGGGAGGGVNVVLCASDKTCTPLHQLCDTTLGRCVDCLRDVDCSGGTCRGGACQARVACNNSLDCADAPDGRVICDPASRDCVQCVSSADCDRGQACTAHLCTGSGAGGGSGRGGTPGSGGIFGVGGIINTGGSGLGGAFGTGGSPGNGGTAGSSGGGGAPPGTACAKALDCESKVCAEGMCQPATCEDGTLNGGEASADCGGPCPVCRVGGKCTSAGNCASGACTSGTGGSSGTCAAATTCSDGIQDGLETDTDCGGLGCSKCAAGKRCRTPGDCSTRICAAGVCGVCNPDMCLSSLAGLYAPCCTSAGSCGTLGSLIVCL